MKFYKVVAVENKKILKSAVVDDQEDIIIYKPKKWVTPKKGNGPLCCFISLDHAEWFVYLFEQPSAKKFEVWECEIVESKERKIWVKDGIERGIKDLLDGTVLADKVKLLRKVEVSKKSGGVICRLKKLIKQVITIFVAT